MKKIVLLFVVCLGLTGCVNTSKTIESKPFTIKECTKVKEQHALNIVLEHKTEKQYDVVYSITLNLDSADDIDKELPVGVSVDIIKNGNVIGTNSQWGDSHIKSMASFKDDGNLSIIGNISYSEHSNDIYEEDIIELNVKKENDKYTANIVDYSVK